MNRVIKFRAWDGEKMVSPDYIDRYGTAYWDENSVTEFSNKIMQFTGLQDRNGVDIYEGDLFVLGADADVYEVRFEHACFLAYQGDIQIGLVGELNLIFMKVIGNIHEHKHLLK